MEVGETRTALFSGSLPHSTTFVRSIISSKVKILWNECSNSLVHRLCWTRAIATVYIEMYKYADSMQRLCRECAESVQRVCTQYAESVQRVCRECASNNSVCTSSAAVTFLFASTAAMLSANNTASSTNCLSRRAFTWREGKRDREKGEGRGGKGREEERGGRGMEGGEEERGEGGREGGRERERERDGRRREKEREEERWKERREEGKEGERGRRGRKKGKMMNDVSV